MSTWMSIGFDPNQMDPATEPYPQPSMSEVGNDAAPQLTGGLDQAAPSEFGAVSGSSTRWIAGALKSLVVRHPSLHVPELRPR